MSDLLSSTLAKLGQGGLAILVVFAVILIVFFAAGRATGRLSKPLGIVVFLGPAAVLMIVGLVIPAIRTFFYSFYGPVGTKYVGTDNYSWAFTNPGMRTVLINTVLWIILAPLVSTAFGLVLALLADRMGATSEKVTKSLIFMPMAISFVGASVIWKFVYQYVQPGQPQIGLLEQVALWLGWSNPPNWLLSAPLNTFLLIVIMIWVQTGFAMVVLSAAIKAIPGDVLEAAALDGASGFKMFTRVTIPMIRGTLVVVLTTIMIAVLKIFDIVRTMTGGNFKTSVLANEMYSQTFVQGDNGHGSALAVILFIGVVPLIIYNVRQLRKEHAVR
ncbi:sugar ABC transporter permease [Isoptericola sp. b441]|uniref:Sugar ABC transporter permease n=1 Tax=Actinotalea lenta TaxID=3064654 RepID=A0ABT9D6U1_9CELL|nr:MULTISPECIES: sugar ABC transporter permease [unclassified Isoptericola]MDO8105894.1 sugar ABC transporter permease [Isoptericola sp. b441]MDO8122610.1 sugar ABC transporter permease [Isoptericola sp. b490]